MQPLSEQIASISLPTVLALLSLLTLARVAFSVTRASALRYIGEILESALLALALVFLLIRPFVLQSYYIPSGSMRPTLWENDHIVVNKWVYRHKSPTRGEVIVFRAPVQASPEEREFVKRIVGLPGDTIEVHPGYVLVGNTKFTRDEIRLALGENVTKGSLEATHIRSCRLRLTAECLWYGEERIAPETFARWVGKPSQTVQIVPGEILLNRQPLEDDALEDPCYTLALQTVPSGHYFVLGDNRNQSDDSHRWGFLPADRVIGRAEFIFWPPSRAQRITPWKSADRTP